jgi:hypothetical protein
MLPPNNISLSYHIYCIVKLKLVKNTTVSEVVVKTN